MNTRQVIKLVTDDGWVFDRSSGSHRQYKHPIKRGTVTVPFHGSNKEVPPWMVKSVKRQAGLQ